MASASYREPRPHAHSAAARQEKTRGRRRISRKAPDLPHDAVRAGAESDGRLHTGTTSPEGHSGPSMGKGQLGPFAQSSPPGSHWGICGVVEDYSIAGIQLVTGCNRLGPRNRTSTVRDHLFHTGKMISSLTTSPDEPAPDAAPPAHADFAAGGRGRDRIPSRLRCRFRAGRETSNPEREFDSFLSSCQPVKVEVDTIEPCLGHEKRRLRRTAFAKKQLPVCR